MKPETRQSILKWIVQAILGWEQVEIFTEWLDANEYPAVHHSERYRSLYRPAYRLVAADGGVINLRIK